LKEDVSARLMRVQSVERNQILKNQISLGSASARPVKKLITGEQRDGWRKIVSEKAIYILPLKDGAARILTSICPHLGCSIPWSEVKQEFICPCHGGLRKGWVERGAKSSRGLHQESEVKAGRPRDGGAPARKSAVYFFKPRT